MKYFFGLLLVLLSIGSSYGRPPGTERKKPVVPVGLRETWLGMSVSDFQHLVPEHRATRTPMVYYTRANESLRIGPYAVTGISYGFYQDQLCCIEVRVLGPANCQGIQEFLTRTYGLSQSLTAAGARWTGAHVSLSYSEMPRGYATVVLASTTLLAQYRAARQEPVLDLT